MNDMNKDLLEMFLKAAEFRIIRFDPGFYPYHTAGYRFHFRGNDYGKICGYVPGCDMDELEMFLKEDALDTIRYLMNGSAQP